MGKYEVTFDEWEACLKDGGCTRDPDDHKWGRGRLPVMNITWADARGYANWLREKTGQPYRLPAEAEWEWAAGAGTTTQFWWGDDKGKNLANCRDCESPWSKKGSAPVGSFAPNPFGLHDTAGNSWEWIEDCWNPSHVGAPRRRLPLARHARRVVVLHRQEREHHLAVQEHRLGPQLRHRIPRRPRSALECDRFKLTQVRKSKEAPGLETASLPSAVRGGVPTSLAIS